MLCVNRFVMLGCGCSGVALVFGWGMNFWDQRKLRIDRTHLHVSMIEHEIRLIHLKVNLSSSMQLLQ